VAAPDVSAILTMPYSYNADANVIWLEATDIATR
jgi:hypothetical protein